MATQPIEVEPQTLTPVEPEAERDYETEARKMGWRSEDDWPDDKPKPPSFKDAETFVRDAEEKSGLQKQTINHLKEKISFLERQQRRLMQSEQRAYANALADLKRQQREAVESGDLAAFEAADKQADALRDDMDSGSGPKDDPTPHVLSFRRENPWYDRGALPGASALEVEAHAYANLTADEWVAEGRNKTMPPSQFYKELDEAVNERFPGLKSRAPRQKPPSDVAAPTGRAPARGSKTAANLPAEAKAQAERYMRMKVPGFTKCKTPAEAHELFAKSYQWE